MIKNYLSRLMGERYITVAKLARISGLHRNTISNVYYNRTKQIEFAVIDKLCKALGCKIQDLFEYVED